MVLVWYGPGRIRSFNNPHYHKDSQEASTDRNAPQQISELRSRFCAWKPDDLPPEWHNPVPVEDLQEFARWSCVHDVSRVHTSVAVIVPDSLIAMEWVLWCGQHAVDACQLAVCSASDYCEEYGPSSVQEAEQSIQSKGQPPLRVSRLYEVTDRDGNWLRGWATPSFLGIVREVQVPVKSEVPSYRHVTFLR